MVLCFKCLVHIATGRVQALSGDEEMIRYCGGSGCGVICTRSVRWKLYRVVPRKDGEPCEDGSIMRVSGRRMADG